MVLVGGGKAVPEEEGFRKGNLGVPACPRSECKKGGNAMQVRYSTKGKRVREALKVKRPCVTESAKLNIPDILGTEDSAARL